MGETVMGLDRRKPLHERIAMIGWLRGKARRLFFGTLDRAFQTTDGKAILAAALAGHLRRPALPSARDDEVRLLYPELPLQAEHLDRPPRARPIFITGRFRSGSTLLWNLFRHVEGITSYYEPFNERRWFDEATRGERVDPTHRHVTEYWSEYVGLTELRAYYDERWIDTELFMDEFSWNPDMERFVALLVDRARGRAVLQFNHIDFRLQWLRRTFPTAYLVHIFRHPRDQWCSTLLDPQSFPRDGRMEDFRPSDHFYLLRWARDLKYHFPFLDEGGVRHPYELFYYIWKLSYLFGRVYCDYSLAFERLVSEPAVELRGSSMRWVSRQQASSRCSH